MTVKDAMSRLKNSFAYEKFQKAMLQDPWDVKELTEAIVALSDQEARILDQVFTGICRKNLSPKTDCKTIDEANRVIDESKPMRMMLAAIDRWREELMPDWHERRKKILEAKQAREAAQARA
jgi:hypothetical protein